MLKVLLVVISQILCPGMTPGWNHLSNAPTLGLGKHFRPIRGLQQGGLPPGVTPGPFRAFHPRTSYGTGLVSVALTGGHPLPITRDTLLPAVWTFLPGVTPGRFLHHQ